MAALKLLNFGPNFQTLAKALTSEDARPIRTIKTNGGRSYPFTVGSGMPQGCPLYPDNWRYGETDSDPSDPREPHTNVTLSQH